MMDAVIIDARPSSPFAAESIKRGIQYDPQPPV
jgi:hypothetical protein